MDSLLAIIVSSVMIFLFDRMAKWQMAALASHYAKAPVEKMVASFEEDRPLRMRLVPPAILPLLAACLVWETMPLPLLAVAATAAILIYCAISFGGWMRIIRSS